MKILYFFITFSAISQLAFCQSKQRATGDVDGDGVVDIKDVTYLTNQILEGHYEYITVYDGYTVNVKSSDDNYGVVAGGDVVAEGEEVILSATANEGYDFDGWYYMEELLSSDNPYTFSPEKDMNIEGKFSKSSGAKYENGHEYIDLGLSVKWATMNIGASEVAGTKKNSHTWQYDCFGEYYAWGDTVPKNVYSWNTLSYCNYWSDIEFTKYNTRSGSNIVDNKKVLEPIDDAAHVNWGGSWRMPTYAEQLELKEKCYWEYTTNYRGTEIWGYIVYKVKDDADKGLSKWGGSKKITIASYDEYEDTHIFLPFGGCRITNSRSNCGVRGYYWSSTLGDDDSNAQCFLFLGSVDFYSCPRYYGLPIRAVCP